MQKRDKNGMKQNRKSTNKSKEGNKDNKRKRTEVFMIRYTAFCEKIVQYKYVFNYIANEAIVMY
jgi:hypothetical protein